MRFGGMSGLVSIICPAYNCEQFLPETISSVLGQTYQDWELLICDDGSTDKTGVIADEFASRDSRIQVFHQKNSGLPAVPRNLALQKAQGDYIAFLDGDDRWDKDKLRIQVEFIENHKEYEAVHTSYELLGDPVLVHFYKSIWNRPYKITTTFEKMLMTCVIHISSLLVRREVVHELKGFDEDPRLKGVEDYDFLLHLSARKPIYHLRQILSFYRLSKGTISNNPSYIRSEKSVLLFQKLMQEGLLTNTNLLRKKQSELLYDKAFDALFLYGGSFRRDFYRAFISDPLNMKKAMTFLYCWMPAPLLRRWLMFLLVCKNLLIKRG